MQNIELGFEKDPQLRRNDSPIRGGVGSPSDKWTEAMKDVPSYSDHMKQVESRKTTSQNAFKQASGKAVSPQTRPNAIFSATYSEKSSSPAASNNVIKSAPLTQAEGVGRTGQTAAAGQGQVSTRSK